MIWIVGFERKMKRILIIGSVILAVGVGAISLTGCACTRIKQLSGDEFRKEAQRTDQMNSFRYTSFIGNTHQRAYLESGYPAFIGKGMRTTVYWTPLSELPTNLVAQMNTALIHQKSKPKIYALRELSLKNLVVRSKPLLLLRTMI